MNFNVLFSSYLSLGGVAALITVLVNVGKYVGLVKDGTAQNWSFALNVLALIGLFGAGLIFPGMSLGAVDQVAAAIANIGAIVLGLAMQMGISRLSHKAFQAVPVIGFSHTKG